MKRWNGISMGDRVTLPLVKGSREHRIGKLEKPVTPNVKNLIAETHKRCREVSGEDKPDILAQEMLTMLQVTGDRTYKGLAKDLHISQQASLGIIRYLEKKNLVETWRNKRKILCVGGL